MTTVKKYDDGEYIVKQVLDKVFEISNRLFRNKKSNNVYISDSQQSFYPRFVKRVIKSKILFRRFRRSIIYRQVLDHVPSKLGFDYLECIRNSAMSKELLFNIDKFRINDSVGKPYVYTYPAVGIFSPTTLRYIATMADMQERIGTLKGAKVCELGVGYGGQASILHTQYKLESYIGFDLPEVNKLCLEYLQSIGSSLKFTFGDLSRPVYSEVFISNYAFSELPRNIQLEYVHKVLKFARRGYMIMNSGRTNFSGRSDGKMSLNELQTLLPYLKVTEEFPNSGIDNYVITWLSE